MASWCLSAVTQQGLSCLILNSLVRFDRTRVVYSTIHYIILPCHHCNLHIFYHLFCLLAHIIKLFAVVGTTAQHLNDLLSPYSWSPSPTNVLNSSFVCWHLAQHMLTSQSYCSRLCTFTVTISYSQQALKIFLTTTRNQSNPLNLNSQLGISACLGLPFIVTQYISKQWYHLSKHSG